MTRWHYLRLYLRMGSGIINLLQHGGLVDLAQEHVDTLMPGPPIFSEPSHQPGLPPYGIPNV